jgi:hypothetical protein
MTKFYDIRRQWEVKYKSPSTGQMIVEIISDEELLDDFLDNLGCFADVQEIFV